MGKKGSAFFVAASQQSKESLRSSDDALVLYINLHGVTAYLSIYVSMYLSTFSISSETTNSSGLKVGMDIPWDPAHGIIYFRK